MIIKSAAFVKSATNWRGCPEASYPEYAFFGRSNVGKSSLLNMLTSTRNLAKTSSTPGKTRLINHFLINDAWYLADLPGYGFAKVPVAVKKKWEQIIKDYLINRENLFCSFILIDIRHEPLKNDLDFLGWIGLNQLPFCLVFTKADKLSVARVNASIEKYMKVLSDEWEPLPQAIVSSSKTGLGRDEILRIISSCNEQYRQG